MARTFTVLEVAQHIDLRVREHWNNEFWVRGEVSGLRRSTRGHAWFNLVQTDEVGDVVAQLGVSMPASKARLVDRRLSAVGQPLADGLEIRLKASLSFWVRGGRLSLDLADIDPTHTAGALAVARRELLAAMAADGSRDRQAGLPSPRVPLSLGLITSSGSQAFHDLTDELRASGIGFAITLVHSTVQGQRAPAELCAALARLGRMAHLDLILLTRGGGADIDLVTFDHPDVARAVAGCPRPVWTGIGHHLDSPVAEMVAARAFKTPTALAQGVVATVAEAVASTEDVWTQIRATAVRRVQAARHDLSMAARRMTAARVAVRTAEARLDARSQHVARASTGLLARRAHALDGAASRLAIAGPHALSSAEGRLAQAERVVDLVDPQRLIARGWSVTTDDRGRLVTGPVPVGTRLRTRTRGGTIASTVTADPTDPEDDVST